MTNSAASPKARQLSLTGLAIQYTAIAIGLVSILTRHNTGLWGNVPVIGQHELYANFSNFSISLMLMVGIGVFPVLVRNYRKLGYIAAALVAANLIAEIGVTILNTRDIRDAYAGIIGVGLGLVFLWLISLYGVRELPEKP